MDSSYNDPSDLSIQSHSDTAHTSLSTSSDIFTPEIPSTWNTRNQAQSDQPFSPTNTTDCSSVSIGRSVRNSADGDSLSAPHLDYIGSPLYCPNYKTSIMSSIRTSARVLGLIEELAQEQYSQQHSLPKRKPHSKYSFSTISQHKLDPLQDLVSIDSIKKRLMAQTETIMEGMVADMTSTRVVRFFGFVVQNILARMYHRGVHINEAEIARLKLVAQDAQNRGLSLVFLPCHKSHIDYLVVSYILYRLGFALPHIAAGDNLNMPFVGWLLRHNGAFFIRRQWGDDRLYNGIMKEYIEILLERGYNIEAFVEGTRSRTGKPLQPKFGVLKIILDAVWNQRVSDLIIVPVSIGYDKVIETPSYADELLGTPKQKESLVQLLNNVNILQLKWGRIDVRFGEPFSLKEYMHREGLRRGFEVGKFGNVYDKAIVLQSLGYKVLGDVNRISVVMPTALVGTTLLTLRGRGVGRNELIRKVNWLKKEIVAKGGQVAEFGTTPLSVIVDRALHVLGDLTGRRSELLEPVYYPAKRFELSFYRNQVIHLFVSECIVLVSMYATIKAGGPVKAQRIPIVPHLTDDVSFLSQLLKNEFVYGEGGMGKNLPLTITNLHAANVLEVGKFEISENASASSQEWVTLSTEERRIGRETFDFYCFLMWPFVETYWLACVSLYTIVPSAKVVGAGQLQLHWVDERVFLKRCQHFGRTLYSEGDLSYFEAVNKETLQNAIRRLMEMGVVVIRKGAHPDTGSTVLQKEAKDDGIKEKGVKEGGGSWIALSLTWMPTNSFPEPELIVEPEVLHVEEVCRVSANGNAPSNVSKYAKPLRRRKWGGHMEGFQVFSSTQQPSNDANSESDLNTLSQGTSELTDKILPDLDTMPISTHHLKPQAQSQQHRSFYKPKASPPVESESYNALLDSWYQLKPTGKLWDLCEQIGRYRREGKNRRDTNTVAVRVLRLARIASQWTDGSGSSGPNDRNAKQRAKI
ncbi:hypothetical protein MT418_002278 [Batrachochytrium dendrobatidis]